MVDRWLLRSLLDSLEHSVTVLIRVGNSSSFDTIKLPTHLSIPIWLEQGCQSIGTAYMQVLKKEKEKYCVGGM